MSISPSAGEPGSTASVVIDWAPTAVSDCPDADAQVRVNGEPSSDLIMVAEESRVEVDIPEDATGDIPITLVSRGSDAKVLASSQFTVEDGDSDEGVSSWLLVAAGVLATIAAFAVRRLYSARKAI